MKNLRWQSKIATFAFILASANAGASIIPSTHNGFGGGGLFVLNSSVTTPSPANPLGGSLAYPNTLYYNETYGPITDWGAVIFDLSSSPASGYAVTLDIQNTSAQAWSGYSLYCGAADLLDPTYESFIRFDLGSPPTIQGGGGSASWGSVNDNWIVWSGLNIPVNSTIQLKFNLDLAAGMSGGWQIQQMAQLVPAPEPSTLALFGLGGLLLFRRRK
jgi:hypothetical protein